MRPFAATQGTVGCLLAIIVFIGFACLAVLTATDRELSMPILVVGAMVGLVIFSATLILPIAWGRPRFLAAQSDLQKKQEKFAQLTPASVSAQAGKPSSTFPLSPAAAVAIPPVCVGCASPHVNETIQIYAPSVYARSIVWALRAGGPVIGAAVAVVLFGRDYYSVATAALFGSLAGTFLGAIAAALFLKIGALVRPPLCLNVCQGCFTRFVAEQGIVRKGHDQISISPPVDTSLFALAYDSQDRLTLAPKSAAFSALFRGLNAARAKG
jgi:ABC-type nickel/cobalt efflux system permease component RcnA